MAAEWSGRSPDLPLADMRHNGRSWLAIALLAVLVLAAYAGSFGGAFVFDDLPAVVENSTIRRGTTLPDWLRAPAFSTVAGRPVLNLTFALNQAISADATWSYHAFNLVIHLLAGGFLFGIVGRTLRRRGAGVDAERSAGIVAALWLVHPLQTESVTYVVQRAESLMGLFYLAAFYCFVRVTAAGRTKVWSGLTLVFAVLGMATKESMVTLPVLLLLYDRIFGAGSVAAAWRRRRWLYVGLAGTWSLLALLMIGTHSRGGSAGFGASASAVAYAGTQLYAVGHYLRLAIFPTPLVFDYGSELLECDATLALAAAICATLLTATVIALRRRPAAGFLGAAYFLLLAPTSSVVPVASQAIAEHRMYLPLAAVMAGAVLGLHSWLGRPVLPLWIAVAVASGAVTFARNRDYRSAAALWADTVAKRPGNARAHDWLGTAALDAGRPEAARAEFQRAVALQPDNAKFRNNLGAAFATLGRYEAARTEFEAAFRRDPGFAEARHNLGQAETRLAIALIRNNRLEAAIPYLRHAAELEPEDPAAADNLASALQHQGRDGIVAEDAGQRRRMK